MNKLVLVLTALAVAVATAPPALAQSTPDALLYNDGTAELQGAYSAFADQLSRQGSLVESTSDASHFSAALTTGDYGVYGAFGADGALLDAWFAQAPTNSHFLKVTVTPDGDLESDYVSFLSPTASVSAGGGRRVIGSKQGGSLMVGEVEDYATNTADGQQAPAPAEDEPTGGFTAAAAEASVVGWPWDGIVEAITDFFSGWFEDILEWLQCVAACALGCVDAFVESIPDGVEIEIKVEWQTTPPGVKSSITVKGSGEEMKEVVRAYGDLIACLGACVADCTTSD